MADSKLFSILGIAIIVVIAVGFLLPVFRSTSVVCWRCPANLRELARLALVYAEEHDGFLPLAEGEHPRAHESLNKLVESFASDGVAFRPNGFVCSTWRRDAAETAPNGRFTLTEDTCSYTWISRRLRAGGEVVPLASDKFVRSRSQLNGHERGMYVVYTDASLQWVPEEDLGPDGLPEGLTR